MKDTIYIDIDDEITTIIDKVKSSDKKIIALVLPKRAAVLQSIVNMRLLKRVADGSKKKLVLITTEAGIMPLAGMVGLHVARNLQSKPEVPSAPSATANSVATIAESGASAADDAELDGTKSVGELAGIPDSSPIPALAATGEAIPIEIDAAKDAADRAAEEVPIEIKAEKKNRKLAVPNFNKFRVWLFLGILGIIVLIGALIFAFVVMPKANVSIKAELTEIPVTRTFILGPETSKFDLAKGRVPGKAKSSEKPDSEKFPATGEVDKGTKATGTMTIYNCNKDDKLADRSITVPAGTVVSAGDIVFVTDEAAKIDPSSYLGNDCQNNKSTDVPVTAQNAGDKYNVSGRKYTVGGYPSMSATGTAMTGGTSKIVKVISQQDIDVARQKLLAHNTDDVKKDLIAQLKDEGLTALPDTFTATPGEVVSAPAVNEEAAEGTLTTNVTYSMVGVSSDDVKALIADAIQDKYDAKKEKLYNDGFDDAEMKLDDKNAAGEQTVALSTEVKSGPKLDATEIKNLVVGLKRGDAKKLLESRPGIKEASVKYSPIWVTKAPSNLKRITVNFEVPANNDK